MRFFLGTGKYAPVAEVQGGVGWKPIIIDQWKSFLNHWHRCLMNNRCRINAGQLAKRELDVRIGLSW